MKLQQHKQRQCERVLECLDQTTPQSSVFRKNNSFGVRRYYTNNCVIKLSKSNQSNEENGRIVPAVFRISSVSPS